MKQDSEKNWTVVILKLVDVTEKKIPMERDRKEGRQRLNNSLSWRSREGSKGKIRKGLERGEWFDTMRKRALGQWSWKLIGKQPREEKGESNKAQQR